MKVLGMISGTSHDGIDVAIVDFTNDGGVLAGSIGYTTTVPYAPELRGRILAALPPAQTTFAEMCELDTLIGQAFAEVAAAAISESGESVDAIASHGQTVYHWIEGGKALGTLQLGQPAWIAERTGVPVIADVRIRDIAAGGQGAPLVSFLDELLLRAVDGKVGALNLGGISNMTVVSSEGSIAYDIGPANALIDSVVVTRRAHPLGYDADGLIAAAGTVDEALLDLLLAEPYYSRSAPKSTGKELFNAAYLDDALAQAGHPVETADLVATLTELTAATVASDVHAAGIETLVVSGGGWRNPVLIERMRARLPGVAIVPSDDFGVPSDEKEAIAFALIGWCTMHGSPSTIPSATGADEARVLGAITPGAEPLRLPEPLTDPVRALRLFRGSDSSIGAAAAV